MTRLSYRKTSRLFGYSYLNFTKTATSFYLIQRTTISFLLSILYSILFGLNQIQPQGPYDRGLDVFKYINKTIDLICLYQFSLYCVFGVNIVLSRYLTFSRIADFDTWQIAMKKIGMLTPVTKYSDVLQLIWQNILMCVQSF